MRKWLTYICVLEIALLGLALIGPGDRVGRDRGDHDAIARLFSENPGYRDSVLINFVVLNVFIAIVLAAAAVVSRQR